MKVLQIILIIFCCALKSCVFGQTLPQKNIRDKEAIEIAYITECIKANRKIDNLIEWKLSSRNDSLILYEYKGRLAFFTLQKDKKGIFLHKINYFKSSFQKMIYINNNLIEYEITNQTRFKVWMSKDRLSVYFCMMNSDNNVIWVLTNGNSVYMNSF